jgi:hypothetical protein
VRIGRPPWWVGAAYFKVRAKLVHGKNADIPVLRERGFVNFGSRSHFARGCGSFRRHVRRNRHGTAVALESSVSNRIHATAAFLVALTYATPSFADDNHRPNRSLLSTGVGVFVVSYGATAFAGALSDQAADKNLAIPVVGPWMDLAGRDCTMSEPCANREGINQAMIITSGIVQGAAVLMSLGSFVRF